MRRLSALIGGLGLVAALGCGSAEGGANDGASGGPGINGTGGSTSPADAGASGGSASGSADGSATGGSATGGSATGGSGSAAGGTASAGGNAAAGASGSGGEVSTSVACAAQDAYSEGNCRMIDGYRFTGYSCEAISCRCVGSQCSEKYTSAEACAIANATCLSCKAEENRLADDGCNRCSCGPGGSWEGGKCTKMACKDACPPARTPAESCSVAPVVARSPQNPNRCCSYPSACEAPERWRLYPNEAACLGPRAQIGESCKADLGCTPGSVCEPGKGCTEPTVCVAGCHDAVDCAPGQTCATKVCVTCPCPGTCG